MPAAGHARSTRGRRHRIALLQAVLAAAAHRAGGTRRIDA
jgi:hypothetical protein